MTVSPSRLSFLAAAFGCMALTPAVVRGAVDFEKQIFPVLQKKCMDCHAASHEVNGKKKEPKADLRLDAAFAILKGSKNGKIITPKASDKSRLYEVVTLPEDDDDAMPPKGKADALTAAEKTLFKQWIDEGASFGTWEGNPVGKPVDPTARPVVEVKREHIDFYNALEKGVKPASEDDIKKAKAAGAQVATISVTSPLLRVDFLTGVSQCTDEKVAALLPLAENIAHVDLGRTAITDGALTTLAKFPRLAKLDLRQTKVTDKGVEALSKLKNLQSINLYSTQVGDAGLASLSTIKSLQHVTAWQSKATEAGAAKLKTALPKVDVTVK
ncbi:MAG: leucine-rich repeat, ribonuclease inhibitor subtype [Verrucomicrobiaceae bacterium]|nr:leucine-rich repeat, ribonuclease inhibitor subtype [Verrucomicrobiaceae bacterium]